MGGLQVMELLEAGERFRHFGETKMNKQSSRSHTVFRMVSLLGQGGQEDMPSRRNCSAWRV